MKFGTIIADPPWSYNRTSSNSKLSGYADKQYGLLSTDDLCLLPVGELAHDSSVLLMWATFPFVPDALKIIEAWGFSYVTAIPWLKVDSKHEPSYGVGYWFRGCAELILVGKRKKSYRSNYVGLVSESFRHSRKPETIHALAEAEYPGPRLELFARRAQPGWYGVGNELDTDGADIRETLANPHPTWRRQEELDPSLLTTSGV